MTRRLSRFVAALRGTGARLAGSLRGVGLADVLVLGGSVSAIAGTVQLFGWPVALLAFGAVAMIAGVVLAVLETRGTRAR